MDCHHVEQTSAAPNQPLQGGWYFSFYFSPPTWSAGTRAVVASVTT
jgi:hypothetical protein